MWRSQKGSSGRLSLIFSERAPGWQKSVVRDFRARAFPLSARVLGASPRFSVDRVHSALCENSMRAASVHDALHFLAGDLPAQRPEATHKTFYPLPQIKNIDLVKCPKCLCQDLASVGNDLRIGRLSLMQPPAVHMVPAAPFGTGSPVRDLALPERDCAIRHSDRLMLSRPMCVRDASERLMSFPHIRRAEDPARMNKAERDSFRMEINSRPAGSAGDRELLAIFRRVPAELISRLRYLPEKQIILFTLVRGRDARQVRVHDIAVVSGRTSQSTEVVVHRTKCRVVQLI